MGNYNSTLARSFKDPAILRLLKETEEMMKYVFDPYLCTCIEITPRAAHWVKSICPYCRTDPVKMTCVNCGAPQTIPEAPRLKEGE